MINNNDAYPQNTVVKLSENMGSQIIVFFFNIYFYLTVLVLVMARRIFDLHRGMQDLYLWHVGSTSPNRAPCIASPES